MLRGVRGATTVENNTVSDVLNATKELLKEILDANSLNVNDIASIIFSATDDLNAEFTAKAARLMGLDQVPLLCSREIAVPKSLEKCIRVLMHINSNKQQKEIKHIYLKNAKDLRKE